ncbi:MAG TPA: hypothetical protein VM734_13860 [Kofleriaceae bacterium]|nr:hypothetical protein [Kofleriaceae bacterium]
MDSIFDEEADEVGGEIEAYCPSPRCKADTTHTIISMYEDEVRRVQCVVCGEVHAYRKPRGDGPEEGGAGTDGIAPRRMTSSRVTWKDAMARASEADLANCRPYSIRDTYEIGDVVAHPKFDVGFVIELLPDNKVAMVFKDEDEPRVLVHNRGDLAPQMPGISEIPPPRDAKKKKRPKKKEDAGAPVSLRSEADMATALEKARNAAAAKTEEGQRVVATRLTDQKGKPPKGKAAKAAAPPAAAKGAAKVEPKAAKAAAAPAKVDAKAAAKAAKPVKAAKPAKPAAKPAKPVKAAAKAAAKPAAKKAAAKAAKPAAKAAPKAAKKAAAKKPAKPAKPAKKKK